MTSVLMIVNGQAGRRGVRRDANRVASRLQDQSVEVDLQLTGSAEEAARIIAEAEPRVNAIVAVGGDGTLRGVISATSPQVPVGLVPRGTANVVARELGIPLDPRSAADEIARGQVRQIDVGHIEGRGSFLAMVGVGFDGQVVQGIRPGPMKAARMGISALGAVCRLNLPALQVSIDGVTVQSPVYSVIASNTRNYGGWFAACPEARPDDGLLDAMLLQRPDRRALLRIGTSIVRKRRGSPAIVGYERGRDLLISAQNGTGVPVQADGDPCGTTPIRISIRHRAASIIAPERAT